MNLGPTGMMGWFYQQGNSTNFSRQILVTKLATGSPAAGIMNVGDVILIFSGEHDANTRQQVEGYLAHKWGLSTSLPGDHRYKAAAPGTSAAVATLDGTVSDGDGDPLTLTWSVVSGPGAVVFGGSSAEDTTVSMTVAGTYVLRLTASDGSDQTISDVTITVNPAPPAGYVTWSGGEFANAFTLRSVDQNPDGDSLNNLLEFAFGTDPTLNDSRELAVDGSVNGPPKPVDAGGGVMEFYFMRRVDHGNAGSINYTAQFSSDLGTFYDNVVTPSFVATSSANPEYELVKVTYPASLPNLQKARFGRVMVGPAP